MDITKLLDRSRATNDFKQELLAFERHEMVGRISASRPSPRVKVMRVMCQLLHAQPELEIERVHLDARSGCSDYAGVVTVEANGVQRSFQFVWCCQWRAQQEQWYDWFGLPDQMRAAREFGWDCFSEWSELTSARQDDERTGTLRLVDASTQLYAH